MSEGKWSHGPEGTFENVRWEWDRRELRKRLAEAEQRAERAEKELADESAKAAAAVGYGSDDALWQPGETAIDALIRARDAAELQAEQLQRELDLRAHVSRVERQLRLRAERELERWRLRLWDRARRRKEETEGDHGIDWLAERASANAVLRGMHGMLPGPYPTQVMDHLWEPVALPLSDAERRAICDRLGIDVAAWAQQIRARARRVLKKQEDQ